jgi:hypothetical protein
MAFAMPVFWGLRRVAIIGRRVAAGRRAGAREPAARRTPGWLRACWHDCLLALGAARAAARARGP